MSSKRRIRRPQRRISAILRGLSVGAGADITVGDIANAFDARAFGAFFILFGGMNAIPLPPGASLICGLPLCVVSLQLALGRRHLWLPERVRAMRFSRELLARVMARIGPPLRRAERLARHRYWPAEDKALSMAIGWFALFLSSLVLFPAPLTNMFPGIAVGFLGVALTVRDGLWLGAGVLLGIASIILLAVVYGGALYAFMHFI
ncbi:exopolysaccharide biosynthesis protein [Mangrovicella endophytica]|uniref:exopolysaccharide biosynthesis protein n=1 Tax=Mangrovicella endophytica TaxID=2066697 RepID=UPI000C9E0749|nr:exopolysaccharide biosynthesis protein [Mangrovicella endophytica]